MIMVQQKQIIIVDDHLLISNSLKRLVESYGPYKVISQLSNGKELVSYLSGGGVTPSLILLDVKMPIMDGKETIKWLSQQYPHIPVLVLSMDDDERTIINMLKYGAKGYILKDIEPQIFKNAIEHVINGGFFHTNKTSNILVKELNDVSKPKNQLSERELNFLKLCCSEFTYKEIAAKMYLSPKTIDGYRENLFKKFDVKNRIGLVMFAIRNNFIKI